jgi:hypothetical protein
MVKTKGGENRSKGKRAKVLTKAASRGSIDVLLQSQFRGNIS